VTVEFCFTDRHAKRIWLVLDPHDVSVCLENPGFDTDVVLTSRTRTLFRVYMGRTTFDGARRSGDLTLEGLPSMVRAFPRWITWSHFAPAVQATLTERSRAVSTT
jgi:hypothetical protein